MLGTFDIRTDDMPAEMRALLADYPRDSWGGHPGSKEKTQGWLRAHQMFRHLGQITRKEPRTATG